MSKDDHPYRTAGELPEAPPYKRRAPWTAEELDEIAGVAATQLREATAHGLARSIEVSSESRRLRQLGNHTEHLPQPVLPTACDHKFGRIFGRNKCKHCGKTRAQISIQAAARNVLDSADDCIWIPKHNEEDIPA